MEAVAKFVDHTITLQESARYVPFSAPQTRGSLGDLGVQGGHGPIVMGICRQPCYRGGVYMRPTSVSPVRCEGLWSSPGLMEDLPDFSYSTGEGSGRDYKAPSLRRLPITHDISQEVDQQQWGPVVLHFLVFLPLFR